MHLICRFYIVEEIEIPLSKCKLNSRDARILLDLLTYLLLHTIYTTENLDKISCLIFFQLSLLFIKNTILIQIWCNILRSKYHGIENTAFGWYATFLRDQTCHIKEGEHYSPWHSGLLILNHLYCKTPNWFKSLSSEDIIHWQLETQRSQS